MSVLVPSLTGADMVRDRDLAGSSPEILTDLASAEALWRGIESDPGRLATPYQRFDWVAAYLAASEAAGPQRELRIVVLRDAEGRPQVLLPLVVATERGTRVARVVGDLHANYHMPLFASRKAAAIDGDDFLATLVGIGPGAGIDVYALVHQPSFWDGAANPLARRAQPSGADAYGLLLGPDPEATAKRVFSADARKKLRVKEGRLAEAHGPVACRRAETSDDVAACLAAFHRQKADRFSWLGLPDPYADASVRRFLAVGTACAVPGRDPAIEAYALVAPGSGRIFATFLGAVDGLRFSGMATSFDPDPDVRRSSPGEILLYHLIRDQTARGRRAFDLGIGEAQYKTRICDETIQIGEVLVPVSLRGRVFAFRRIARTRLVRRLKRHPHLLTIARRLRALRRGAS